MKNHLLALRDSILTVGIISLIGLIIWGANEMNQSRFYSTESYQLAIKKLDSYNANHVERETWQIYQPGRNEGDKQ